MVWSMYVAEVYCIGAAVAFATSFVTGSAALQSKLKGSSLDLSFATHVGSSDAAAHFVCVSLQYSG